MGRKTPKLAARNGVIKNVTLYDCNRHTLCLIFNCVMSVDFKGEKVCKNTMKWPIL